MIGLGPVDCMALTPSRARPFHYRRDEDTAGEVVVRYMLAGPERRAIYVDRTIEALCGFPVDEFRRRSGLWLARVHPDDRAAVQAAWRGELGPRWSLEYRMVRADESMCWVHDEGSSVGVDRHQISGRVVEITRRRRLEERLRFQAQLLDAVGQAIVAADGEGRITYWNRAAEGLYALPSSAVMGRLLLDVAVSPEHRSRLAGVLARGLQGQPWSGQLSVHCHGEGRVPALVTLAPLTADDGDVRGVVVAALDVSDRVRGERQVVASEERAQALVEELRRLTAHLQVVREQEQTRIGREVHDELGQIVTAIKLEVSWLRRRSDPAGPGVEGEQLRERLARLAELADETLSAVQQIAVQLRPRVLDDLGLATAIEWLAKDFETRTGIPCTLECSLDGLLPDDGRDTAAFRIVQEALTNVARHSGAMHASLAAIVADGFLSLQVRDDGKGVPAAALRAAASLGLTGMRERALACGGRLKVRRLGGKGGTLVAARLPVATSVLASQGDAS